MENTQMIVQGDSVVTSRQGKAPVIPFGSFATSTAAAMVVNFLRTGAPSVQCLGDEGEDPERARELIATVEALALPGEKFDFDATSRKSRDLVTVTLRAH
jgi:hypothetical protein